MRFRAVIDGVFALAGLQQAIIKDFGIGIDARHLVDRPLANGDRQRGEILIGHLRLCLRGATAATAFAAVLGGAGGGFHPHFLDRLRPNDISGQPRLPIDFRYDFPIIGGLDA